MDTVFAVTSLWIGNDDATLHRMIFNEKEHFRIEIFVELQNSSLWFVHVESRLCQNWCVIDKLEYLQYFSILFKGVAIRFRKGFSAISVHVKFLTKVFCSSYLYSLKVPEFAKCTTRVRDNLRSPIVECRWVERRLASRFKIRNSWHRVSVLRLDDQWTL